MIYIYSKIVQKIVIIVCVRERMGLRMRTCWRSDGKRGGRGGERVIKEMQ